MWIAVPGTYEKWIDHARKTKMYKAIFRDEKLARRVSITNFKTATQALAFAGQFNQRCLIRRKSNGGNQI